MPDSAPTDPSAEKPDQVNILIVDDSPDKLMAQESIIADLGQNIVKVNSGSEALRRLLKDDFAVILLDVNMPVMNGYEVAELIRQRPTYERVPIIFVTSYSRAEADITRGYALGAVDYITTPIIAEVLRSKVSVFVELARHRRALAKSAESLKRMHEESSKRAEALAHANAELQAFSYTIAHDLRAPLRAMDGMLTVLLDEQLKHLDPDGQDLARRICASAQRLDRMIQELLHYSRISLTEIELKPVRLDAVFTEAISGMEKAVQERNAQIKVKASHATVVANYTLLLQVVTNLLSNALKFVPPGRAPLVQVTSETRGDSVRVWVEDNGLGIEAEHQQRVFRVFERLHAAHAYPGTGIGLAIVHKSITRMGGLLGVESTAGEGSRFWFELKKASVS